MLNQFPVSFRSQPRFPELQALVAEINGHEAMRVGTPQRLNNLIRASLGFTSCFWANLLMTQKGATDQLIGISPFIVTRRTDFLHLVLALASEELATNNIATEQGGFSPHYVPMLEAAQAARVETSPMELQMQYLGEGLDMAAACRKAGFRESLVEYYVYSEQCTRSFEDSFATIALRELILPLSFPVIVEHLPGDAHLDKWRIFLTSHIELDGGEREAGEENHGELMAKALEGVKDVEKTLSVMIGFCQRRLAVYNDCLQPHNLF